MKTEISLLSMVAAGVIYVFGLIVLSLHLVRSFAILAAENNWATTTLDKLLD